MGHRKERVVLFGSLARQGLEPVGEVRAVFFLRPFLHAHGDHVGQFPGEFLATLYSDFYAQVSAFGQKLFHGLVAKYIFPEIRGDVGVAAFGKFTWKHIQAILDGLQCVETSVGHFFSDE